MMTKNFEVSHHKILPELQEVFLLLVGAPLLTFLCLRIVALPRLGHPITQSMSSVRSDLESIAQDSTWCLLFEERLKKNYSFYNFAFWVALRDLKVRIESGESWSSEGIQQRLDHIVQTYFDTESAQSIALSFRAKERVKRCPFFSLSRFLPSSTHPFSRVTGRAINQWMR